MRITVHTLPACIQCERIKLWLDRKLVPFTTNSLLLHPEAMDDARDWADLNNVTIQSAPVVVVEDDQGNVTQVFTGYRLDLLPALAARYHEEH